MKRNAKNLRKYKKFCLEIYKSRNKTCELCGRYLPTLRYHNIAHTEGRRTEEKCLDPNNVRLLCYKCHSEQDHGLSVKNSEWLDS